MIDSIKELENKLKSTVDSNERVDILLSLASEYKFKDIKRAIDLNGEAQDLAEKISYKYGIAKVILNRGVFFLIQSNFEKALPDLVQALKTFEELDSKIDKAHTLNAIGGLYQDIGNYSKAMEHFIQSLKIQEELKNEIGQAANLIHIASIYHIQEKYALSLDYNEKALKLERKTSNKLGEAVVLGNIGKIYQKLEHFSKALQYQRKSLKIKEELGDKHLTASCYGNIGIILASLDKLDEALENHQKSLKILREVGDKARECGTMENIGSLYFRMKNYLESIKILSKALSIAKEIKLKHFESMISISLYKVYKETGDFEKALEYYEKYHEVEKQIFNDESEKRLNELMVEFQVERTQKDAEIYRLKNVELIEKNTLINSQKKRLENVLEELQTHREHLEEMVGEKTAELQQKITEREQAEEKIDRYMKELERSNKELEQFAYVASHDLQEPLRMVSSYTQLIEERYKDKLDKDANEFIDFAVDGANRMQILLNDLLNFSRVTTRGKPFEPVDLNSALGHAIMNMQMRIEETKTTILNDELPTVKADESQIIRVFQNLIDNAIKFRSENSPKIHISAKQEKEESVFSVKDNGIGIEPEYKERIFQIFQRLHGRKEYPGTGMGLSICKRIVERHGGRMWLESESGKGTTFYFTIPKRRK